MTLNPAGGGRDQVPRLDAFRQVHPDVDVRIGEGWWQATVPEANGGSVTILTCYTLEQLLDRLDDLLGSDHR